MSQRSTALQWLLDTEDEYLTEFFDYDIASEGFPNTGEDHEPDAIIPEWVRDEFEYHMRTYED